MVKKLIKSKQVTIEKGYFKEIPLLNGKWGSLLLMHLMFQYLSIKYNAITSKIMTDMILNRIIDIRPLVISGGEIVEK